MYLIFWVEDTKGEHHEISPVDYLYQDNHFLCDKFSKMLHFIGTARLKIWISFGIIPQFWNGHRKISFNFLDYNVMQIYEII